MAKGRAPGGNNCCGILCLHWRCLVCHGQSFLGVSLVVFAGYLPTGKCHHHGIGLCECDVLRAFATYQDASIRNLKMHQNALKQTVGEKAGNCSVKWVADTDMICPQPTSWGLHHLAPRKMLKLRVADCEARLCGHCCFLRDLCEKRDSMLLFNAFNPVFIAVGCEGLDHVSWNPRAALKLRFVFRFLFCFNPELTKLPPILVRSSNRTRPL